MKKSKPNFGKLVRAYDNARPSYPSAIVQKIRKTVGGKNPLILDIGCGTGISTRQLALAKATVIGCDIDGLMLNAARKHAARNVAYIQSPADKLPFRDGTFDGVTAFQALHWFVDKKSLKELKRVLKKGGALCVVQPMRTQHGRKNELRELFHKHFPMRVPPYYMKRDYTEALKRVGFKKSGSFEVRNTDKRTLDDFILLIESFSIWNMVPDSKQAYMRNVLRKYYRPMLQRGYIVDRHKVSLLVVRK